MKVATKKTISSQFVFKFFCTFASFMGFTFLKFLLCFWYFQESNEPSIWEKTWAIWYRWTSSSQEGSYLLLQMTKGSPSSKAEDDPYRGWRSHQRSISSLRLDKDLDKVYYIISILILNFLLHNFTILVVSADWN